MAERKVHAHPLYIGTTAERGAFTIVQTPTYWFDTDTDKLYYWDGSAWIIVSDAPADLADYARGSIVRGGAAEWEAYVVGAANEVLTNDGTDVIWSAGALDLTAGFDLDVEAASAVNQDLTTDASPTHANVYVPNGGVIGVDGGANDPQWVFDDTNNDVTTLARVGVGTATPPAGVNFELYAGAGSNPTFRLSDADVAIPFRIWNPTTAATTCAQIFPISSTAGGLSLAGFSDSDSSGLAFAGLIGSATPTVPAVIVRGYKTNGGVGTAALAATEIVLQLQNTTTPLVTLLGDGKLGILTAAPTSNLQVVGLTVYANNAAAVAAGLTAGAFYRTGGDPDLVCVVH